MIIDYMRKNISYKKKIDTTLSFNTPIKIQSCSKKETFLDNTQNNTLLEQW